VGAMFVGWGPVRDVWVRVCWAPEQSVGGRRPAQGATIVVALLSRSAGASKSVPGIARGKVLIVSAEVKTVHVGR
jgi:hypothetical protein